MTGLFARLVLLTVALVLLAAGPAAAGGSSFEFDRATYHPGDPAFAVAGIGLVLAVGTWFRYGGRPSSSTGSPGVPYVGER